jgi:hypothetical protein
MRNLSKTPASRQPSDFVIMFAATLFAVAFSRPPAPIAYTEWTRSHCSEDSQIVRNAGTAREWQDLWTQLGEQAPRLLKRGEKAIGIYMGIKPSGGFGVRVADVGRVDNAARVDYYFISPGPGDVITQALTTPCVIVAVETGELALTAYRISRR